MKLPKNPDKKLYKVSFQTSTYIYADLSETNYSELLEFAKECFKRDNDFFEHTEAIEQLNFEDLEIVLADENYISGWNARNYPYEFGISDFAVSPDDQDLGTLVLFNQIGQSED